MSNLAIAAPAIAFIVLSPIATVWMLNTLFGLGLAYGLKTWAAALILNGMLTVNVKKS